MKQLLCVAATMMLFLASAQGSPAIGIGKLYARYPNWEGSPIFNLRIKTLDATVTIQDQMAVTHVDQVFANDNYARLEGFYVFQLPEGANVNEMALWINGIRVPYVIKKRAEAIVIYQEIVRRLTDPAILEQLGKNLFKLRIFPIDSFDSRRIEIQYLQPLTNLAGTMQYLFPLDMTDYTSSAIERVSLSIDLQSQSTLTSVETSVDQFPAASLITKLSDNHYSIVYGVENVTFAKNYALRFTVDRPQKPMLSLTYVSPDSLQENPYFILWTTLPDTLPGSPVIPARELTFVADVSSSMEGARIKQLRDALNAFVDLLTAEDKFNIITFGTSIVPFKQDLVTATVAHKAEAKDFIARLVAIGLTNIDEALHTAVSQTYSDSIRSAVVFLTDGEPTWGVVNSDSILAHVRRGNTSRVRIFPVGVGTEAEVNLLETIAQQNGGILTSIASDDSITIVIGGLFHRLFTPVLSNVTLDYGQLLAYDLYPSILAGTFAGGQVIQTGRFLHGGTATVRLAGTIHDSAYQMQNTVFFSDTSRTLFSVARFWGAQKIQYLLNLITQVGEVQELVDQVVNLSIRYGVLTPYTAFLVIEPNQGGGPVSVHDGGTVASMFALYQNYPNPFNPSTTIPYTVPGVKNGGRIFVSIVIYDILGSEIKTLIAQMQEPGAYRIIWDGTDNAGRRVASGTYLYRLIAGGSVATKHMVLLK